MVVADDRDRVGFHVLDDLPAEVRIGQLRLRGLHLRHAHFRGDGFHLGVQLLDQEAAVHAHILRNRGVGTGHVDLHHAEVLLGGEDLQGFRGVGRGDDDLQEDGLHAAGHLGGKFAVHAHDAAVDAHLVGLIGGLPGLLDGLSHRGAAGIHMLEGHAEGLVEVPQHVQGRIGVLDVVVGQFLALDLLREGQGERSGFESGIEVRALVRVLAVAEALLDVELQEELLGQAGLLAHVRGDAGVVFRRVGVGLGGELQAGFRARTAVFAEFRENGIVIVRVAHDGDVPPVLGGAAHHRRTTDVDVLDGILQRHAFLGYGLPERIQVHAHELDGLDTVFLQGFHVGRDVASGQDAAMHLRMQGLHAAVTDLREAGDFADADGLHAFGLEEFLGTAGGDDLPAQVHQALDELHEAGLVTYTN